MISLSIFLFLVLTAISVQQEISYRQWLIGSFVYSAVGFLIFHWSYIGTLSFAGLIASIAFLKAQTGVYRWVSEFFYKNLSHMIPKLSATEEQALKIGDAWLEEMIFQGKMDWTQLSRSNTSLTAEEQSFLDVETQILCDMLDQWEIDKLQDLPQPVWQYLKEKGFFGLVISKEFGGKGFSARAHSDVVMKIASRSTVAAITVMVPNSLGPGELLLHYGTDEQKSHYLPRLANGQEVPCFALTEPQSGSDATSIQSKGVVCYGQHHGKKVLGLRIKLEKRWITLAPIATLIGAAIDVRDPDGLLDGCGKEGITCILMERNTPHLEIGARHIPSGQPFMNGTVRGKDIFLPLTTIIGGQSQAGNGWQMLVECLSIGRSISLPTISAASSAIAYLTSGAFARLRRQFSNELVHFEGIQEKLASVAGLHYLVNCNRLMTLAAVDAGIKPAVASAMAKYFNTELSRLVVNDAMDLHGGRLVVDGPRNYLIKYYQSAPISITVEGANIMTRNLLIFGQGSMVCHPYVKQEFYAIRDKNVEAFHQVFWQHVKYSATLFCKALATSWSGGYLCQLPKDFKNLNTKGFLRLTQSFAWVADMALVTLGGNLKRKERLSARLADAFSYLYLAMSVFADQKPSFDSDPLMQAQSKWALQYCYAKTQQALLAFIQEYPIRPLAWMMKAVVAPFGQTFKLPNDELEKTLAFEMTKNSLYRSRIKQNVYLSGQADQPVDRMEMALQQYLQLEDVYAKIPEIKRVKFSHLSSWLDQQIQAEKITAAEKNAILLAEAARFDALLVDEFLMEEQKLPNYQVYQPKMMDVELL